MLRVTKIFENLTVDFIKNNQNLQLVRWKRKPLWMPTAKSKLFRVPKRPVIPKDEEEEIKRLFNNYRTGMKTIRSYLYSKHSDLLLAEADTEHLQKDFEEDFIRCNELNNKWNEEVGKLREARVANELEAEIEFAKRRLETILEDQIKEQEEVEELVRREKDASHTFITTKNIDEAIEQAINNPVDYNFSIDLEGNYFYGRETKPTVTAETNKIK